VQLRLGLVEQRISAAGFARSPYFALPTVVPAWLRHRNQSTGDAGRRVGDYRPGDGRVLHIPSSIRFPARSVARRRGPHFPVQRRRRST